MRKSPLLVISLAVVLFGVTSLGNNSLWAADRLFDFLKRGDQSVCYNVTGPLIPGIQVIRLNVKKHSVLTTGKGKYKLKHPRLTTYTAVGNTVTEIIADNNASNKDGNNIVMWSAEGSVVKAEGEGARMGGTVTNQLADFQGDRFVCNFECGTKESSATPEEWTCEGVFFLNDGSTVEDPFTLTRVNPLDQPLCSFFSAFPNVLD